MASPLEKGMSVWEATEDGEGSFCLEGLRRRATNDRRSTFPGSTPRPVGALPASSHPQPVTPQAHKQFHCNLSRAGWFLFCFFNGKLSESTHVDTVISCSF